MMPDFICQACGEVFGAPVWHCPECDHHYHDMDAECGNCHAPRPPRPRNALARIEGATRALAEARSLDEVKQIMDLAEAAVTYARAAKLGLEAQNYAAEIKLRAERKAGEVTAQLDRSPQATAPAPGPGRGKTASANGRRFQPSPYADALAEAGATRQDAARWQEAARIPEPEFEAHIEEVKARGGELTSTGVRRVAQQQAKSTIADRRRREAEEIVAASSDNDDSPCAPDIVHTDVLAGLAGIETGTVDLLVVDPPYNIGKAEWDKRLPSEYTRWCADWISECARILKPTGAMYVFGYPRGLAQIMQIMDGHQLVYRDWIVWDTIMGAGGGLWVNRHEDILYYSRGQDPFKDRDAVRLERHEENVREYRGVEYNFKNPSNIWRFPRIDDSAAERTNHPTQKPLALIERIVRASSPAGGLVVDPFVGSGTTCVAAMRQQRRSIGIDNDPDNITIARARIAAECAL